jgi:hypothetical protein
MASDREMFGDDVRGGRKLLAVFMPIPPEAVADGEHPRACLGERGRQPSVRT